MRTPRGIAATASLVAGLALASLPPTEELWQAFADEAGFVLTAPSGLEDRAVLLTPKRGGNAGRAKRAIAKVAKAFDRIVPPAEGGAPTAIAGLAALVELPDREAFGVWAAFVGSRRDYLAGWAKSASASTGCVLEDPLAAAWLRSAPELEEWNAENELTNRVAQVLLVQRHGRLPQWLVLGLAWHIELEVCRDVYCFPFRDGFVGKKEHAGWAARLAERGESAPGIEELAGWARGTYDADRAALAWGAATLMAEHYEDEFPRVLERLAAVRDRDGRVTHADGSWEPIPGWEIPPDAQRAVLDEVLGVDFLTELARFCRSPRGYRRPR